MIRLKSLLVEQSSMSEKDFWTLVAICVAEVKGYNPLEYAKVAQSIYNRLNCNCGYGDSIADIITKKGQYQPTFKNRADWLNITDYNSAVTAFWNAKKDEPGWKKEIVTTRITDAANDLKAGTYQSAASKFVGSRTEFLASAPTSDNAVGLTADTSNVWFWNYNGKKTFFNSGKKDATPIPSFPNVDISDTHIGTETEKLTKDNITLYPNPVNSGQEITIRILKDAIPSDGIDTLAVKIYTTNGKLVKSHNWNNIQKGILQFNAPNTDGVYLVKLVQPNIIFKVFVGMQSKL